MKTITSITLTAAMLLCAAVVYGPIAKGDNGPQLLAQGNEPQLGQSTTEVEPPPAPGIGGDNSSTNETQTQIFPQAPKPQQQPGAGSGPPALPTPAPAANAPSTQENTTMGELVQLMEQGQFENAVRRASRAMTVDPAHAADYKRLRADAYVALGRYEEALADVSPLELTVTAPQAELKTKQTVLGIVSGGTKVFVDDVNGAWLKVIAAGDKTYEWAWIRIRDVRPQAQTQQPQPQSMRVGDAIEYNIPSYGAVPPQVYPGYGPPYYNYGRDYYDYWPHVPQQYWQFLPY